MKNFKIKYLFIVFLAFIMLFTSNNSVKAGGTSGSYGSYTGPTGNSAWEDFWGIGTDYSVGLNWKTFNGTKTLECKLYEFSSTLEIKNSSKAAYLQLHNYQFNNYGERTGESKYTWLRWGFWDRYIGNTPKDYSSWYSNGSVYTSNNGKLPDPELVTQAVKDGFLYSPSTEWYYRSSDGRKLDAVWVDGYKESKITSKTSIVKIEIDDEVILDRTQDHAKTLYESPTISSTYEGKSKANEISHEKNIKVTYINVTKTSTYMTDGVKKWNIVDSYLKGGTTSKLRKITYEVQQPSVGQKYFQPFDLNRNGVAKYEDVKDSYPSYNADIPLKMSVDNKQEITNGSKIQTLDTNTSTLFKVKFNNDQFGIPTSSQGGFDLLNETPGLSYKKDNGTYNNSVISHYGDNGTKNTGIFWSTGMSNQNIKGNISRTVLWNGNLKATISSENASITYDGTEKIGGKHFSFNNGFRGGYFSFKTIKTGDYNLSSNNRNWWEVQYEKGYFYGYGVKYRGIIDINGIGAPSIEETNLYTGLSSRILIQPVVKGIFNAKTVGGSLG